MAFSARQVNCRRLSWNRVCLLYGPSGTGKTSLCQALAQKLSIRLSKQYGQTKLIEIHCHSLFSKYFSESGKLVAKMFASIESILDERDTFLYVLIDEIESLASAREHNIGGSEPRDSLRVCFPGFQVYRILMDLQAVNVLLTALDRLRSRSNVLVLCTSNLIEAMVGDVLLSSHKLNEPVGSCLSRPGRPQAIRSWALRKS